VAVSAMSDNPKIGAIILAAGSSRRMGRNKALLPIDGQPMIARVVALFAAARVAPIIVVTGYESEAIESLIKPITRIVHNPDHASRGMLSSIKIGAATCRTQADAFFLALVDHPCIRAATLMQLIDTWKQTQADVVRPAFHGKHGHPILIAAHCIDAILALRDDDQTLNDFVRAKSTRAVDVPVEDSATIHDIDTPADYDAATKRRKSAD
jgi:CTP:molybdopterin cytidylyltransferase MocA